MTPPGLEPPPGPIAEAARALAAGGIVCFPTESSYGLAVDPRAAAAVAALVALKGRGALAPIALIAASRADAAALARVWPARADELAARHWPGPLTLVVPARADLPAPLVGPDGGVGVRVSPHPWAAALAALAGGAITATSANPSGRPAANTCADARAYFGDAVACYLDAGPAPAAAASTVVAVTEDGALTLLRRGPVDLAEL